MPNQDYGRGGTLDKYEYKIRAEEIKQIIFEEEYVDPSRTQISVRELVA